MANLHRERDETRREGAEVNSCLAQQGLGRGGARATQLLTVSYPKFYSDPSLNFDSELLTLFYFMDFFYA